MIEICLRVISVISKMNTCHKDCISYSSLCFSIKLSTFRVETGNVLQFYQTGGQHETYSFNESFAS